MEGYQKNRVYELIVGDSRSGEAFKITNDLQVTFDISKSVDNKKRTNSAAIEIYNLSPDQLKTLDTDYTAASFSVGYLDTGSLKRIFGGQVNHVSIRKNGTDVICQLQVGSGYVELNHQTLSDVVPRGKKGRDIANKLIQETGASRGVINSINLDSEIIQGYSLYGSPKEALDLLCEKYNCNWQRDDDVVYINDNDRANTENFDQAYVISAYTGLVENAYRVSGDRKRSKKDKAKKPGIQFKILLNPDIVAGDIIRLEDTYITGWFRVDSLRHTGGWRSRAWYTEIRASYLEKVDRDAS